MSVPDSSQYISSVKGRANSEFKGALGKNGPKSNSTASAIQYSNVKRGLRFSSKPNSSVTIYTITPADIASFDENNGVNGSNISTIIKIKPGGLLLDNKSGQTVWCLYYDESDPNNTVIHECSTVNGILNNSSYTETDILATTIKTIPKGYLLLNPKNEFYAGFLTMSIIKT